MKRIALDILNRSTNFDQEGGKKRTDSNPPIKSNAWVRGEWEDMQELAHIATTVPLLV